MRNAFRARRKQSFLNGKIEKPAEDVPEIEDWWNGQTVAAYFGRLKILWDELSNMFNLLSGLAATAHVIYPLPLQSRAYALVVQDERHQTITRTRDVRVEAVSFAVQAPKAQQGAAASFSNNVNGEKSVCKHCGKTSHEISSCFKIIGYPEWWTANHGKGNTGGRGQTNNSVGRSKSHAIVANAALIPAGGGGNQVIPTLSAQDWAALAATLTDDQWATMVNMLNSQNKDVSKEKLSGKWILDTGASRHMTGSRELMTGLPNGTCSHAQCEGTVEFGNNLRLNHVLYDRTMRTLIGVGEQEDGVYIFWSPASANACRVSAEGNYYLWHRRLGHASNKIISLLPDDTFPYHDILLDCSPAHDPYVTHDSLRVQHVESPLPSLGSNRDFSSNDAQEEPKSNDRGSPSSPHAVTDLSFDLAALHDRGSSSFDVSLSLPSPADENIGISVRWSTRPKIPNTRLRDFVCHTARVIDPVSLSPAPPLSSGTPYPIANFMTCANFSANHSRFLAAITTLTEPTSIGLWLSLVVN
ncbi:retrovirus-related pol polyprotein from transposon RE1 [Citrus sinensis]|nr:retrovirus-related pol polyprotein from transposon RE1 [Citrus sinensis]